MALTGPNITGAGAPVYLFCLNLSAANRYGLDMALKAVWELTFHNLTICFLLTINRCQVQPTGFRRSQFFDDDQSP